MNASASASSSSLKWRGAAAGRSCGAGQRAAPYPHLAIVAGIPPVAPQASRPVPATLAKPRIGPFYHSPPRAPRPNPRAFSCCPQSVQEGFDGFSPAAVKPSQAPPNRPAPQTPDPKPQTPTEGQGGTGFQPVPGEHAKASRSLPRQFLHGHQYPVIWGQCRVAPRAAAPFGATPYLDMAGRLANTDGPNIYG